MHFLSLAFELNHLCLYTLDAFNALTEQAFGYSTFGYWKWFNTEGAGEVLDRNVS